MLLLETLHTLESSFVSATDQVLSVCKTTGEFTVPNFKFSGGKKCFV